MAEYCLNKFISFASVEDKVQVFNRKLATALTNIIAIRARKYDSIVNDFITKNPDCIVVNLG